MRSRGSVPERFSTLPALSSGPVSNDPIDHFGQRLDAIARMGQTLWLAGRSAKHDAARSANLPAGTYGSVGRRARAWRRTSIVSRHGIEAWRRAGLCGGGV